MSDPLTNGAKASILWEGGTMSVFKGFGEGVIKVFPNIIDAQQHIFLWGGGKIPLLESLPKTVTTGDNTSSFFSSYIII